MDNHETIMHRKPVMKLFCNILTKKKKWGIEFYLWKRCRSVSKFG